LAGLSGLFSELMRAVGANERVFQLLDRAPKVPPAFLPQPLELEPEDWVLQPAFQPPFYHTPFAATSSAISSVLSPSELNQGLSSSSSPLLSAGSVIATYANPPSQVSLEVDVDSIHTHLATDSTSNPSTSSTTYSALSSTVSDDSSYQSAPTAQASSASSSSFSFPESAPTSLTASLPMLTPTQLPSFLSGRIQFSGVSFSYPTRPEQRVLCGVSLNIRAGSVTALVGPSGTINSMMMHSIWLSLTLFFV
jgi:ABC-type multidrug transport system fused ATPase/permease subunit